MAGMRILLTWADQLRRATAEQLPAYSAAVLSQFEEVKNACDTFAARDHNDDGTHNVVRIGGTTDAPSAVTGRIALYWDGTDLKAVKPDGTVKTVSLV